MVITIPNHLRFTAIVTASFLAMPVAAAFAQAETFTETQHQVTETFEDVHPCTGAPATITSTFNGIFHHTTDGRGATHLTFTQTGDFTLVPDDASEPTVTGHFTIWGGENDFTSTDGGWVGTFTFSGHGTDEDDNSLKFNGVEHVTIDSDGNIVSEVSNFNCRE
jgi:hypothetical protein